MDKYQSFRQFISPFLNGSAADALIDSLADEGYRGEQLSIAVNDQLTLSTAQGTYLDGQGAQFNFTRPPDVGVSDDAFRALGIAVKATQQISTLIQNILEIFYGPLAARAYAQSGNAEPYALEDGMELWLVLEDGKQQVITFTDSDFTDINQATAAEVADVVTRYLRDIGYPNALGLSYTDPTTGLNYVQLFGTARGPYSQVIVNGGQAQSILQFPTVRDTDLPNNDTVWQVTKNYGTTLRFRWDGGSSPLLENVQPGDTVLIYGNQFQDLGLGGTFTVTAVQPPQPSASYAFGWFEVQNPANVGLLYSVPGIAPPPNSPGETYSISVTQASYLDMVFFQAKRNTPYSKARYAVGFESARQLLKVYLPATTQVVQRSTGGAVLGAGYLHMLYPATDLQGTFGSATVQSEQLQIINPYAFRYPDSRLDNYGSGGTVTYGSTTVDVSFTARESGYTTVECLEPHGLVGINHWNDSTNYLTGDVAYEQGFDWIALQPSGPGEGGAQPPVSSSGYWQRQGPAINYCATVVDVSGVTVQADDPSEPFPGPYLADLTTTFTLTAESVSLRQAIQAGDIPRTLSVLGTLPVSSGVLLFDLSQNTQEQPVPFVATQLQGAPSAVDVSSVSQEQLQLVVTTSEPHGAVPGDTVVISGTGTPMDGTYPVTATPSATVYVATSSVNQTYYSTTGTSRDIPPGPVTSIVLSPTYQFSQSHAIGSDVDLLSAAQTYVPAIDGSDFPLYVTSTAEARQYAQTIIQNVAAAGINLEIVIVYPGDEGLGNAGDGPGPALPESEETYVWGADTY